MEEWSSLSADQVETTRRGFLKLAIGTLTLLVGLFGIPLLVPVVSSAWRTKKRHWAKVAEVSAIPAGQPVSLTFIEQTDDAYLRETLLHAVWAMNQAPATVVVFSPICPHLGCIYNWDAPTGHFECPCHGSVFAVDGAVLAGPSTRSLDTLPSKIEGGALLVQWERFKPGIPQKIPV